MERKREKVCVSGEEGREGEERRRDGGGTRRMGKENRKKMKREEKVPIPADCAMKQIPLFIFTVYIYFVSWHSMEETEALRCTHER